MLALVGVLPPVQQWGGSSTNGGVNKKMGGDGSGIPDNIVAPGDNEFQFVVLAINDVYEMADVRGGTEGDIARLATWKKRYTEANGNVISVLVSSAVLICMSIFMSRFSACQKKCKIRQ
jgi:hypothetical protein